MTLIADCGRMKLNTDVDVTCLFLMKIYSLHILYHDILVMIGMRAFAWKPGHETKWLCRQIGTSSMTPRL